MVNDLPQMCGAVMVLCSCKIMMYTIARDPDIAIFVEMMSNIQKSLLRFGLGFIWLFVGQSSWLNQFSNL